MRVLKFGGSSLATAHKFKQVENIIKHLSEESPLAVVLSAPYKITDTLDEMITLAATGADYHKPLNIFTSIFKTIFKELFQLYDEFDISPLEKQLLKELTDIRQNLTGIALLKQCPDNIYAQILVVGERLSVYVMSQILSRNSSVSIIDPCQYLVASSHYLEANIDLKASIQKFENFSKDSNRIFLMPGFTAANKSGELVTLGRNGSDYSATSLAACLNAENCQIWTDVNGVYNVDPSLVKDAQLIKQLSYEEAMELSYFGATILHPKTIGSIAQHKIPCYIKNTSNPQAEGTLISQVNSDKSQRVSAISSLSNMSLCNVSGPGMKGLVGMASRIFGAISRADISISLITQSSSEYSISFCISSSQCKDALVALENEFELELVSELLDPVEFIHQLCIVSLIGDNMKKQPGIAANFFQSLAHASINIIAIAQGSSERSVSTVISKNSCTKALAACHYRFFDPRQHIEIFLIGNGNVGSELLNQINQQQEYLNSRHINLKICAISNSRQHCLNETGLSLNHWKQELQKSSQSLTLDQLIKSAHDFTLINPVVVDCTSSSVIAKSYIDLMQAGFHIVTPNKLANTDSIEFYQALRLCSLNSKRRFLYDTNVGAGLPVIENLQNLLSAGDKLIRFQGILSGSISFIFGLLDDGTSLSDATQIAKDKCFTEPDPRDDLSGADVARKILIIARETGLALSFEDIEVESLLPEDFDKSGSVDEFMQKLPQINEQMEQRLKQAQLDNKRLRYVASLENNQCKVSIEAVASDHPLYEVKGGENALAFYSQYYQPIPLVLRGYGAGVSVTAAGVFADILRTLGLTKEV